MIDSIRFAFITTHRQPAYIHQALASFFASSPWEGGAPEVDVLLDAAHPGPLDIYRHHVRIRVLTLTGHEGRRVQNWGPHRRCCYNHWRALSTHPHDERGLCVFEDDVVFRERFADRLGQLVRQIEAARRRPARRDRYALALYSPYDFDRPGTPADALYCDYDHGYYGAQAMYYSRDLLDGLAGHLWSRGVAAEGACADLLIDEHCRDHADLLAARCSLVQHIGRETTGLGHFHRTVTFNRTWPAERRAAPPRSLPASPGRVRETNARAEALKFLARVPDHPAHASDGCGIVICGGGVTYFTCAYVCIRLLRALGCDLPIELWHIDDAEMNDPMRRLVQPYGVTCMRAADFYRRHPVKPLNGWQLKPFAIIHSRFREVLLLDADNVPAVDPTFLFHAGEYRMSSAVFWPDYGRMKPRPEIWKILGIPFRDEPDFESGQILLDKQLSWKPLMLAMHLNEHSRFYYRYMWGDKDTFHLAWRMLDQPYTMIPYPIRQFTLPGHPSLAMGQHGFDGRILFQHRNQDKWRLDGRNLRLPGFQHEQQCRDFLAELASQWPGRDRLSPSNQRHRPLRRIGRRVVRLPAGQAD